jgi:phage-related protein
MAEGFQIATAYVTVTADTADLEGEIQSAADSTGASVQVPVVADTADLAGEIQAGADATGATATVPVIPDTEGLAAEVDTAAAETGATVQVPVIPDTEGLAAEVDTAAAETGATATVPVVADTEGLAAQIDAAVATSGATATVMVEPDVAGFPEKLDAAVAGTPATALVNVEPDPASMTAFREKTTAEADAAGAESGSGFGTKFGNLLSGFPLFGGAKEKLAAEGAASGEESGGGFVEKFGGLLGGLGSGPDVEKMGEGFKEKGIEAGQEYGGSFGSAVMSKITSFGLPVAIAAGIAAVAVHFGEQLETSQMGLEQALKTVGLSWAGYSAQIDAAGQKMSKFGFTQDQVDSSLASVVRVTGSMKDALASEGTIADIAATKHIDLASATQIFTQSLAGAGRGLKQMGIVQATGATEAKAMASAQQTLGDQISQAGGMAKFAAQHNLSLRDAQKLVSGASKGNITDLNKLGIEVLPKTATAADKFKQVNELLADKMGKSAADAADTFGGKLKALEAKLKDVAEKLGAKLMPYLSEFVTWVERLVGHLEPLAKALGKLVMPLVADYFKNLVADWKNLITWAERLAGDLEPLAKALAKIAMPIVEAFFTGLWAIIKALTSGPLKDLSLGILAVVGAVKAWSIAQAIFNAVMDMNPFIALGVAIVLLVGLIIKYHKQILDVIEGAWKAVASFVSRIWDDIYGFIKGAAEKVWDFLKSWGIVILGVITGPFGLAVALIVKFHKQIFDAIKDAWNAVYDFVKGILDKVVNLFLNWTLIGLIIKYHAQILKTIEDAWNTIYSFFSQIITKINTFFTTAWDTIYAVIKSVWTAISGWFTTWWNTEYAFFSTIITKVIAFFTASWNLILTGIKTIWTTISGWFTTWWNTEYSFISTMIAKIIAFFTTSWNTIYSGIKTIWTTISGWFTTWWNTLYSWINTMLAKIIAFLTTSWNTIKSTITTVWNSISSFFTTWWNTLYSSISSAISKIESALTTAWNAMKTTATTVWNSIATAFTTIWNTITGLFSTGVAKLSSIWTGLKNDLSAPWNWIVSNVFDNVEKIWNDISKVVPGMGSISLAEGGKITQGTGPTSDDVLARVSKNETVVSAAHSRVLAPVFSAIGVPGYASGGIPGLGIVKRVVKDVTGVISDLDPAKLLDAALNFAGISGPDAKILENIPVTVVHDMVGEATKLLAKAVAALAGSGGGGVGTSKGGPGGGAPSANAALARSLMPAWASGAEWAAWNTVAMDESGWSATARNASGAYGIPQALPASKMGPAANPPESNPTAQIEWMIGYIKSVYGDPIGAAAHEASHGWYDQGGVLPPGKTLAVNNTGVPERVIAPGSGGVTVNFNGVQFPSPEQVQALSLALSSAVGVAG